MPARAPDPHNLRAMTTAQPAPIIQTDRPCLGCGYNLRGLRAGINCPECGMPSVMPAGIDEPLALMPRRVILAFVWGCWVASICVVGVVGAIMASRFPDLDPLVPRITLVGLSLLWLIATWMLTPAFAIPQAVFHGFSHASKVRKAARLFQIGWVLTALCALGATLTSGPATSPSLLFDWGMWLGFLSGIAGVIALCVLMEQLADWTRDESAKTMFNWAMWGLPVVGLLLMLRVPIRTAGAVVGGMGLSFTAVLWGTSLIFAAMFPYALLSLSKSVSLSIVHSFEHEERTKRRDERTRQYHARVGEMVEKMDKPKRAR